MLIFTSCSKGESPREYNGKGSLWAGDSLYYVTFRIDSVLKKVYEAADRDKFDPANYNQK